MPELPMLPSAPTCPAALSIAGACGAQRGVVCRAMQRDVERDDGTELGMNAGEYGFLQQAEAGVYLNLKGDPSTVTGFCHGDALPMVHADDLARASYTSCPVWQAAREAGLEGREELVVEQHPEPVAMGVSSLDAPDPWAAARAGLEELAPERVAA